MGGAFVAVADDSSAVWWNPGALAAGPVVDVSFSRLVVDGGTGLAAGRDRTTLVALTIPVFGISYAKVRTTEAGVPAGVGPLTSRVTVRSLDASQLGITLVQTVTTGVHVGTTLKAMSGAVRTGSADGLAIGDAALDAGEGLEVGDGQRRFDLDVGALAVAGPVRLGLLVRNLTTPEFGEGAAVVELPRQVRLGFAFSAGEIGGPPLVVSMDVDATRVAAADGERRGVAFGAEHWLFGTRVGVRGGLRLNTVGREERVVAGGVSVALTSSLLVETYGTRGREDDDRGWGLGGRLSF
ncbi:MAG: hypothetical protein FJW23_05425 [Acidimicrobiia bacterium]|nr:hypothetical protein [Acidimicrobiia bacterium]